MAADLDDNLVLVLSEQIEVDVVRVGEPHGMVVGSSTTVHVLNYDELASFVCQLELLLEPEHLLHAGARAITHVPLAVVIERIDREDADLVTEIDSIVASFFERFLNLSHLVLGEIVLVAG